MEISVAKMSETIRSIMSDGGDIENFLPTVESKILKKVITYCKKNAEKPDLEGNYVLAGFLDVDSNTHIELIMTSIFLTIIIQYER